MNWSHSNIKYNQSSINKFEWSALISNITSTQKNILGITVVNEEDFSKPTSLICKFSNDDRVIFISYIILSKNKDPLKFIEGFNKQYNIELDSIQNSTTTLQFLKQQLQYLIKYHHPTTKLSTVDNLSKMIVDCVHRNQYNLIDLNTFNNLIHYVELQILTDNHTHDTNIITTLSNNIRKKGLPLQNKFGEF